MTKTAATRRRQPRQNKIRIPQYLTHSDMQKVCDPRIVTNKKRLVCEIITNPNWPPERITISETCLGLRTRPWYSDTRRLLCPSIRGTYLWSAPLDRVEAGSLLVTAMRIEDGRPIPTVKKVA
jgi:hypothetical protein